MNSELKLKPSTAAKLLQLNVTSEEEEQQQQQQQQQQLPMQEEGVTVQSLGGAVQLSVEESQLLLQKLSINNPFYRFRKQSNSLKELRRLRRRKRRYRSEADLPRHVHSQTQTPTPTPQHANALYQHNEAKVVVVLDSKQQVALSNPRSAGRAGNPRENTSSIKTRSVSSRSLTPPDNSTVITNPFSIFHDDEILTLGVNPRLRSATRPQRSSGRGLRRLFEAPSSSSGNSPANPHYLHRFERQDFTSEPGASCKPKRSSKAIFKQLSLRKLRKADEQPPTLPKLKLSYRYPNRTQSIQSMRTASSGGYDVQHTAYRPRLVSTTPKSNYFERLQAKTRQGIQKIRDKCRNFKAAQSDASSGSEFSGFHTLAKDESFRFISDRAHISSYESRCAAAHAAGKQATIYKSYKSEIDLSKNLHYLEHYLEQNFEQQQQQQQYQHSQASQSSHSMGRAAGQRHRRSQSQAAGSNYENLGTLPISAARRRQAQSDSLSSSDYASVFSGPEGERKAESQPKPQLQQEQEQEQEQEQQPEQNAMLKLRYEHPDKMCEYYFDNLSSYALGLEQSEDLLLAESAKSARFFYDDEDDDDDEEAEAESEEDEEEQGGLGQGLGPGVRLSANEPDYMARDIRIRVNVNEFEQADWQQSRQRAQLGQRGGQRAKEPARSRYNENLAESTFYQSLNQHLQRQAIAVDGALGADKPHEEKPLGGESYLAHFQHSFERLGRVERSERTERTERTERAQQRELYTRGEYYGFGAEAAEPVYATKQTHYVRSRTATAAATSTQQQRCFLPGGNQALRTAATATDALYATSSKQQHPQQQQQQQQQQLMAPSDAMPTTLATAAVNAATACAAGAATATPAAGNLSAGNASANNRFMLENLRKYYANQQQHPPAHSVNSSSLSNSSSSNSSMSQQQKLQLPTAPQQQQQQPHQSLHQTHQSHQSHIAKQQLQHLGARRNSSTSNASSTGDHFDNFIALRNATAAAATAKATTPSAATTATAAEYMGKRRAQQQHATASGGSLISALNYYGHGLPSGNSSNGTSSSHSNSHSNSNNSNSNSNSSNSNILTYNGKLSATAMLSQVNLGRAAALQQQLAAATPTASASAAATIAAASAAATATSGSSSASATSAGASFVSEHESFILEYEC
ncbi:hypothetical protein KR222_007758 [Zaprionus bogoriensis]|nr:hypothetical protein KR222_007758 [Zaprionus bogoriensis]